MSGQSSLCEGDSAVILKGGRRAEDSLRSLFFFGFAVDRLIISRSNIKGDLCWALITTAILLVLVVVVIVAVEACVEAVITTSAGAAAAARGTDGGIVGMLWLDWSPFAWWSSTGLLTASLLL
jgi:hypothetical protein